MILLIAILAAGTGLAPAQTIAASQASLNFSAQAFGSPTLVQMLTITSSGPNVPFTASASAASPWLIVSQSSGTTPGSVSVQLNPASLGGGTYAGTVVITAPGATNSPLSIPVTATVGLLQAMITPGTLTFASQSGSTPAPQTIHVGTNLGTPSNFLVTVQSAGTWLSVDRTSGSTPQDITVTATPGTLPAGTYSGNILITVPGAFNTQTSVAVTLNITSPPLLAVSPGALTFNYQVGQTVPVQQTFTVTSGGAVLNYNVTPIIASGGNFLAVNSSTGTTPGTVSVGVNPVGLTPNTYQATLAISAPGAANTVNVPVTLVVSVNPLLSATPSAVAFSFQTGGAALTPQSVALASTGGTISFTAAVSTASGGPWLTITPASGSTPNAIAIMADPTGLATGTYMGAVTLTLGGAGIGTVVIPVTLGVNTTPGITANPSAVSFVYQTGTVAPAAQSIAIGSTVGTLNFTTTSATLSGGAWLTASGTGATPGQISVTANPVGLTPGSYSGTITVSAAGATNSPLQIPATLLVSANPLLTLSAANLSFTGQVGNAAPASQGVTIGSTTPGLGFSVGATTTDGANWLTATSSGSVTPATITVTANPTGLRAGNYVGTVTIGAPGSGNSPQMIAVAFTVAPPPITLSPASLTFNQVAGGPAPAAQSITLGNPFTPLAFTATAAAFTGGNWLSVTPTAGAAPGLISVSVNGAALAAGTYMGSITIAPTGSPAQVVPVTLVVGATQTLSVAPAALAFNFTTGAAAPAAQNISVTGTAALPFTAAAATASGGNWLTAAPANGTSPASVSVSVNPAGLAGGSYTGSVTIASTGASNSPLVVPVTLTVTTLPPPSITALVNAASFVNEPVSPGEIVTLGGTGIGPATLMGLQVTAAGTVATNVGNTQVFFDGIPAPIVYVSATQTSVVAPYALSGRVAAQVQVVNNGVPSNLFPISVAPAALGIFAGNSAGSGQGAILNQNGSVNSAANPASVNQVIVIFATGEGITTPTVADGSITGNPAAMPVQKIGVTIGGQPATVTYAGAAPTLIAGVLQVNAIVPQGAGTGNVSVLLTSGSNKSQPNITVALQ